jgi:hypothetical protein
MSTLTPTQIDDRRKKRLLLLVADHSKFFDRIRALEKLSGISIAELRPAKKKKSAKTTLSPRLLGATSPRHLLLAMSPETYRQWRRGELAVTGPIATKAVQALIELVDLFLALLENSNGSAGEQATLRSKISEELLAQCRVEARDLRERLNVFLQDCDSDDQQTEVYKSGLSLGMTIPEIQQAVDVAYYATRPLLLHPYRRNSRPDQEALNSLQGLLPLDEA